MSYILDALRRAEADRERERGQVPGLHTQPPSATERGRATGARGWLPWAAGGLLLLTGIGVGSWWVGGAHENAVTAPPPPPAPAPATEIAATPQVPATPPVIVTAPVPPPASSASPYLPPAPPPAVVAPVPAAEAPLRRWTELPESARPKLAISGSVYSEDPATRFVIVNGEVLHEGAKLGDDLLLEQIRPRELVLRFKGQRYRQPV